MFQGIKMAVASVYSLFSMMVPSLRYVPLGTILAIIDSIEAGHNFKLRFTVRIKDYQAFARMIEELGEAVEVRTEDEQREAIYAMLVWCTDIEDHMTMEDFMAEAQLSA